jgi:hypothetical protein
LSDTRALPLDDGGEQLLGFLLVADEVVVNDEDVVRAETMDLADLGHHLIHGLRPRPPPVHHDDVAELARERTAARELDRHAPVLMDLHQIEARQWRVVHARLLVLPVLGLPLSGLVVFQELRPRVLRLVNEDDVHFVAELLGTERGERTAGHDELSAPPELRRDLEDAALVDHIAGEADDVRVDLEVDRLDVLVHEDDVVLARRDAGDGRQREIREDAFLVQAGQNPVERPERLRVLRGNQADLHPRSGPIVLGRTRR